MIGDSAPCTMLWPRELPVDAYRCVLRQKDAEVSSPSASRTKIERNKRVTSISHYIISASCSLQIESKQCLPLLLLAFDHLLRRLQRFTIDLGGHVASELFSKWSDCHGETDAGEHELGDVVAEDSIAPSQTECHKGKLSTLAQNQANTLSGSLAESKRHTDTSSNGSLQGDNSENDRTNQSSLGSNQLKINLKSNCEEEKTNQDSSEGRNLLLDGVAVLGLGEQDTGKEGTQSVGKSQPFRQERHTQNRKENSPNKGFLAVGRGNGIEERLQEELSDQSNRSKSNGCLNSGRSKGITQTTTASSKDGSNNKKRHDGQVLQQEDTKRRLPELGVHFVLVLQKLKHEGRAGKGKPTSKDDLSCRRKATQVCNNSDGDRSDKELTSAQAEHIPFHAHQSLEIQVDTHLKEEKYNTKISHHLRLMHIVD
mmetsp:Transcript_119295/g.345062  ORF Transcript_119295/g.345062 Transcript_119295/m.345062 type:complete len:426 (-) Transcript_119295:435-1712(-)